MKGRVGDEQASHRDFAQDGGFLCPSEIKYAKPKRGKTAQGVWKDIVNVNDYTQTLRMEKCLKPGGGCRLIIKQLVNLRYHLINTRSNRQFLIYIVM